MAPVRWPRAALVATALGVAALLAALGIWRGEAYWGLSDGVYAITARELLHGGDLYRQIAAAQPPGVFLVGAALLGIDDSLTMLRAGLELWVLATALLAGTAVLRLTSSTSLAALTAVLVPFTPIALHENALLMPETLGAPLILATALLAADERRTRAAAALGALCLVAKLSFALPVLAVFVVVRHRRRLLVWWAACAALLAAAGTAIWGGALWGNILEAQWQLGGAPWHFVGGFLAQAGWNELPLIVLAGLGLWALWRRRDVPPLARTLVAAGVGGLVLIASDLKLGSYINVVQVAEAPLLALGVAGLVRGALPAAGRWRALAAAGAALGAAQSASAILTPDDPRPYTRPFAASGPRRFLTADQVRAAVRQARGCPSDAPYPGLAFIAFVADRPVAGGQPDHFILHVPYHRERLAAAVADRARACPRGRVPQAQSRRRDSQSASSTSNRGSTWWPPGNSR